MIFLKKIHGNMIFFSAYSVKMVLHFPTNMILPFCQKSKDYFFRKNAFKDGNSSIIERDYIYPRKYDTEQTDITAVSQVINSFCHHQKLEMLYKSNNSKWCYVKNFHLLETCLKEQLLLETLNLEKNELTML